jgi:periplasmic protein TonB
MPSMASPAPAETLLRKSPTRPSSEHRRTKGPDRRPHEQGGLRRLVALGLAIMVQLIAGAILFSHAMPQVKPGVHIVDLTLVETPEKPPDPPPPVPTVQLPPALAVVLPAPPALRIEAPKPLVVAAPPAPSPIAPPVVAPLPPPPPAQAPGIEDAFKAAVRAAIFTAHRVPDSARLLAQFGDARIAFTLLDGHARDIRLVASSGHDTLDDAALAAVRDAHYPPVPDELRGRVLSFEITLYHRLAR